MPTVFLLANIFGALKRDLVCFFFVCVCFCIRFQSKFDGLRGSFAGWRETYLNHGNKVGDQPILASGKPFELGNLTRPPNTRVQEKTNWGRGIGYETCVSTPGFVWLGRQLLSVIEANSGSSLSFKADYLAAHSQTIHWTKGISYIWMHFLRGICGYLQSTLSTRWPLNHITVHPIRNTDFSDASVMMDSLISAATKTPKQKLAQHHEILQNSKKKW